MPRQPSHLIRNDHVDWGDRDYQYDVFGIPRSTPNKLYTHLYDPGDPDLADRVNQGFTFMSPDHLEDDWE
jgi:hypothetical protein